MFVEKLECARVVDRMAVVEQLDGGLVANALLVVLAQFPVLIRGCVSHPPREVVLENAQNSWQKPRHSDPL